VYSFPEVLHLRHLLTSASLHFGHLKLTLPFIVEMLTPHDKHFFSVAIFLTEKSFI